MHTHTTRRIFEISSRGKLAVRLIVFIGFLAACMLLSGCAAVGESPTLSKSEPAPKPQPHKPLPTQQKLPRVTIVVSDDVAVYTGITDELVAQLPEKPSIINLQGDSPSSTEIINKLKQAGNTHIVAIGPLAAQAANQYKDSAIIFCQVFNYQDLGLTAANLQGVSMLPPADLQFSAWKRLNPGLQRVGVITGHGHELLIAEAKATAQRYGIELIHREVQSDKEMLYAFKRLTPEIQGLWLVPDDRVLSRRVLREIMAYSVKHHRQVVVFHPELLKLGGLMSVDSVYSDVAKQVIVALGNNLRRTKSPTTTLLPLKEIRIEINSSLAAELALQSSLESPIKANAK